MTNLRLKLTCGSVLLSNAMRFHEFFSRALVPGYHYVETNDTDLCNDALRKVAAMETRIKSAEHPLPRGANYSVPAVWDWDKFEYTPRLQQHQAASAALRGRRLADSVGVLDPALDPDRDVKEERAPPAKAAGGVGGTLQDVRDAMDAPEGQHVSDMVDAPDAASHVRVLQGDPPPRVSFKPRATGLRPPRLDNGRTPMQEYKRLAAQPDVFVWGKTEPWEIPIHAGEVGCVGNGFPLP